MKRQSFYFMIAFVSVFVSCKTETLSPKFIQAEHSGIEFTNTITGSYQLNILNYLYFYNGAGTAIADFNNDGLGDIYFTGNLVPDKLYLNEGNLKFRDITQESGILSSSDFNTGVTVVDINGDGLLDIYVSTVSGHLDLTGHNKLYINKGLKNGLPTFKEESEKYGLNYSGLSTQAAFFDYDKDGDLDMYLLNHSVHPNSNYNKAAVRKVSDSLRGDRLYQNNDGFFKDVTSTTGILNSKIGYGLGVSLSDLNNDLYPDIYIANDFYENDYLYINNQDGTFTEQNTLNKLLGHTSHFSMGTDIADINNDGYTDILSLDMLPENLEVLKASGTEYTYPIYQNQLRNGYDYQFMQNTLQLNLGENRFAETAFQSGIAASEWSWSPLIADFDNDGFKDIYIANGILGATNDMDFVNFISNESIQKRLGSNMSDTEMEFIRKLPQIHVPNYMFKNKGDSSFENVTAIWTENQSSFSNGASYADLDNDGDLDIVVNNVNEKAFILVNNTVQQDSTQKGITIGFRSDSKNRFGIGAKLITYLNDKQQLFENYTTRGFLSAVPPTVFVGLGRNKELDSIRVIWPSGKTQLIENISSDCVLFENQATELISEISLKKRESYLTQDSITIDFIHKDGSSIEFSRDPLIPYANTNTGPKIKVADLNNDKLDDFIILGAKGQATKLFFQKADGSFTSYLLPDAEEDSINEDTAVALFDADNDGFTDILIGSGGNEFTGGKPLIPRLYFNHSGVFKKDEKAFKDIYLNASSVTTVDLDNDGNLDIAMTSDLVPHEFGAIPAQFLFKNDGNGNFTAITEQYAPSFSTIGNVKNIVWKDLDGNDFADAVVIGHWMPVRIFLNSGKQLSLLKNPSLDSANGLWNDVLVADFDKDGDLDIVAGNWGLNTRLTASTDKPLRLYRYDFDANDKIDPLTTYFYKGTETVLATKDELVKQLPYLNKKFLSYKAFAGAKLSELISEKKLKKADKREVFTLASTYFENQGNLLFKEYPLPFMAQISSVKTMISDDFNDDGYDDLLLLGNDSEISTQLGRLDASTGVLLLNNGQGFFNYSGAHKLNIKGASRSVAPLKIKNESYFIVGRNNDAPLLIKKDYEDE